MSQKQYFQKGSFVARNNVDYKEKNIGKHGNVECLQR